MSKLLKEQFEIDLNNVSFEHPEKVILSYLNKVHSARTSTDNEDYFYFLLLFGALKQL